MRPNSGASRSSVWTAFRNYRLTSNMRVDPAETEFKQWLLDIGNGTIETDDNERISLPAEILSNGNLVEEVFGPCLASNDFEAMKKRAILCPSTATRRNTTGM